MKWSFKVANILGIDLKIHISFFLILLLGAMQWRGFGLHGMAFGVLLMSLLFLCVTLHEFGHSVVAQRLGIRVHEIILLPIGGVAMLSRNPDKPIQELLIAVAGPAVNIILGSAIAIYLGLYSIVNHLNLASLIHAASAGPSWQALLVWMLNANIMLVLFNMIPAFPLDGGRVFRALLGFFMPWRRATSIATSVGQFLAIGLGLLAIFAGQIFLGIIAILLYMAAGATRADENARTFLSTRKIGDVYNKHALVLITYEQRHQEIQQPVAAPATAPLPQPGTYRPVPAWPGAR